MNLRVEAAFVGRTVPTPSRTAGHSAASSPAHLPHRTAERGSHISAQKEQRGPCSFTGSRGRETEGPSWAHGGPGSVWEVGPQARPAEESFRQKLCCGGLWAEQPTQEGCPSLHRLSALCPSTRRCKEAASPPRALPREALARASAQA